MIQINQLSDIVIHYKSGKKHRHNAVTLSQRPGMILDVIRRDGSKFSISAFAIEKIKVANAK